MKINDIKKVKQIIEQSYREDGDFLENLWLDILNFNTNFNLQESFEALLIVLHFMIENNIAELIGYDDARDEVLAWSGGSNNALKELHDYLHKFDDKKIKKDPSFLDKFKYPGYRWKVSYPIDLGVYGL